jgi:peptide/nickel transport system permease protein
MIKFIWKRILMLIPVMLGVVLVVFTMMYFSPGSAEDYILGEMATEEDKAAFRQENGLDQPFWIQYFNYVRKALMGDLGTSYKTKRPVTDEIRTRFPTTFKLAFLSVVVSSILGLTTGIISAVKQYSIWDNVCRFIAMIGVSMPTFWLGLLLMLLFSVKLDWLPSAGFKTWKHWIMPALTLGLHSASSIMRMTRSNMLEAIRQDYIRTARAKGQKESVVIWRHALKNAAIPIVTIVGMQFGRMLGGSSITEMVFAIPGLGNLLVQSIKVKNAPQVQGGVLFLALTMSVANLIVDILYAFIDPRIRSQYVKPKKAKTAAPAEAAAKEA